jgi:hypothetical protein
MEGVREEVVLVTDLLCKEMSVTLKNRKKNYGANLCELLATK